ncbi:type II toxin-antitoxin system RelE/ParE family toxin [Streptomyces caatingaensis]|nr:type II toxin-antitoxin system RelE/ParE family toxin [Streptomyces caatingaensis]
MSGYRIQYAPPADQACTGMDPSLRARFDRAMRLVADHPYGCGSAPIGREKDRREATVADVLIRYYVSRSVLTLTIVRVVYL